MDFPRELTDLIITNLVELHVRKPATQWTQLRHITRFHKSQIETHFLTYWLSKLHLYACNACPASGRIMIEYRAHSVKKVTGIAKFRAIEDVSDVPDHPQVRSNWVEEGLNRTVVN